MMSVILSFHCFNRITNQNNYALGQSFSQSSCDAKNSDFLIDKEMEKFDEPRDYIDTSLAATTRILEQTEVNGFTLECAVI
jgi:hypothetical protein